MRNGMKCPRPFRKKKVYCRQDTNTIKIRKKMKSLFQMSDISVQKFQPYRILALSLLIENIFYVFGNQQLPSEFLDFINHLGVGKKKNSNELESQATVWIISIPVQLSRKHTN